MTWKLIARMRDRYVAVVEVIFRSVTFSLIIIFVFGFGNDCWCAPPWQWQIGAFAIFLAYINLLLLFKGIPLLGVPINMLFHIVITFLKLIYLPILLIFSFAIPFYMLFVRDGDAVLVSIMGHLVVGPWLRSHLTHTAWSAAWSCPKSDSHRCL